VTPVNESPRGQQNKKSGHEVAFESENGKRKWYATSQLSFALQFNQTRLGFDTAHLARACSSRSSALVTRANYAGLPLPLSLKQVLGISLLHQPSHLQTISQESIFRSTRGEQSPRAMGELRLPTKTHPKGQRLMSSISDQLREDRQQSAVSLIAKS
jgi:hypothetical protein